MLYTTSRDLSQSSFRCRGSFPSLKTHIYSWSLEKFWRCLSMGLWERIIQQAETIRKRESMRSLPGFPRELHSSSQVLKAETSSNEASFNSVMARLQNWPNPSLDSAIGALESTNKVLEPDREAKYLQSLPRLFKEWLDNSSKRSFYLRDRLYIIVYK